MTNQEMFGQAKWLAPELDCTSPCFRREFTLGKVKNAEITICGLGFFELFINGERVSDELLVPANSQFEKRDLRQFGYPIDDTLSFRIYCMKYNVSHFLKPGRNSLGIRLGCGWYDQRSYTGEGDVSYGRVKLCFNLTVNEEAGESKVIVSDEKTLWHRSEILFNSIYHGERHDCSLEQRGFSEPEFNMAGWSLPEIIDAPESEFYIQTCPADKIIRTLTPKLYKSFDGKNIYDAGEAVSGYALVASLADGAEITVRYADETDENGELIFDSTGGDNRIQQEVFKNTRAGEEYFPHFCWHAFRYFELSDNAVPVEVRVIHSDCPVTSSFESDSEVLNWLYKTYLRTQLDNMHCGVPSDCPHIERLGYTGDGQLCAEAAMLMLDSREFYRKWMEDISDCQDVHNGHVQHTAPFMGGGGGPAAWGGAIVVVPWVFYRCYGEKSVLERFLPKMLKYFDYMLSRCENGLVCREEEGGWCLGDWCAPVEELLPKKRTRSRVLIPESYVNTALFVKFMQTAIEISGIIGKPEMTEHLPAQIEKCKRALEVAYFSPMTGCFCGDVQGANSYALDIGIGNEKTLRSTVEKYIKRGMLDTGIVATDLLPRVLFERDCPQLAFDLITSKGDVSFYYMMTHGATTLWEDWYPERSLNHPMFGALTRYLFTYLLGIGQAENSAGFERVLIEPMLVEGLNSASGHITTVRGKIAVSFTKTDKTADFTINLAEGMNAAFRLGGFERELYSGENKFSVSL